MNHFVSRLTVWMFVLLVLGSSVTWAAPGEWAATDLASVDDDFAWTGEFRGTVTTDTTSSSAKGLQVYALGDQQFGATLLEGGLPGNGWNRAARINYFGQLVDGQLTLHPETDDEGSWTIRIDQRVAELLDSSGSSVGTLTKVQRRSVYEGLAPPPNSYVLFDGTRTDAFQNGRSVDGLLQVGADLVPTFHNYHLHVEFLLPYMPKSRSQSRANSGVYLQSRYEVQVLDSFGLEGVKNECGALYRQRAPDLNMAFPPLRWQTYDITFRAPRFDSFGRKVANARLTVLHNGVAIHDDISIQTKTGAGKPEGPIALPIRFQDHSNPVQFRNIWLMTL